jgi:uncharacterized protein with FMN-binding domain
MRRISYWILSTISAVVLLVGFDASRHDVATTPTPVTSSAGTPSGTTSSGTTTQGTGTKNGSSSASRKSAATTVTGTVAQTQWGPVQVQLVVEDGTITSVKVLQYPSGNPRDTEINSYALPVLIKETTDQQSANIDMVSGATVTSNGYLQSLQSALDQANL